MAAFGLAGQLVRRLPARAAPIAPVAGCLLLSAAYAATAAALFTGHNGGPLLAMLRATRRRLITEATLLLHR